MILLSVLAVMGCGGPIMHKTKNSPLAQAQMSPDSVVLDMFFVRFPFGDPNVNEKLWEEIDEQQLSPELRQRLTRNGFRVGLVSGSMPIELSKLLELSGKPGPDGKLEDGKVESLETQSLVMRRHMQLRARQRSEISVSGVYPELPVLMNEAGRLCGQTYNQAQGVFAVKSFPQADGRVRLELAPELQYGQPRQRWDGSQGVLRLDTGRSKKAFDDMSIAVNLARGDMLLLSSLSSRPGSLGHNFFSENDGRPEQKLLVIRLSQTQHDGLFVPPEAAKE